MHEHVRIVCISKWIRGNPVNYPSVFKGNEISFELKRPTSDIMFYYTPNFLADMQIHRAAESEIHHVLRRTWPRLYSEAAPPPAQRVTLYLIN